MRRIARTVGLGAWAVAAVVFPRTGSAQAQTAPDTAFSALHFRPSLDADAFITQPGTRVPAWREWNFGIALHYASAPMRIIDIQSDGTHVPGPILIQYQLLMDYLFAVGLGRGVEVGLALPVVLHQEGSLAPLDPSAAPLAAVALGDVRLAGKWRLRDNAQRDGFGIAVAADLTLPSGEPSSFVGEGAPTLGGRAIADYKRGAWVVGANVGVRARFLPHAIGDFRAGNEIVGGLGARMSFRRLPRLSVLTEVWGALSVDAPFRQLEQSPAEWDIGLRYASRSDLQITTGGGVGLTRGYGAPAFRLFVTIVWAPRERPPAPTTVPSPALVPAPAPAPPPPPPPEPAPAVAPPAEPAATPAVAPEHVEPSPPPPAEPAPTAPPTR